MNEVEQQATFELGQWIGRKQAFGLIAGKTTAAEIECLRRIRDGEMFRAVELDWSDFCQKYVGVSSSYANRLIRQLEEFGTNYFDLSRIMRISPESYRQIAGSVSEDGIVFGGEQIPITPENSDKIADAVKALREQSGATEAAPKPPEEAIAAARRRLEGCIAELTRMFESGLGDNERAALVNAVGVGLDELRRLSIYLEH